MSARDDRPVPRGARPPRRGPWPFRVLRRSVAEQVGALLALSLLVAVTTLAAVGQQRLVAGILDGDLSRTIASASPTYRDPLADVSVAVDQTVSAPQQFFRQVWQSLPDRLRSTRDEMDPALRSALDDGHVVGRAAGSRIGAPPTGSIAEFPASGLPHGLDIGTGYRIDAFSGLRSESRLVEGRWPSPATSIAAGSVVEVAATTTTARAMRWGLGEEQLFGQAGGPVTVRLVGLLTPRPGGSDFWSLDPGRARTSLTYSPDSTPTRHGIVFVDPGSWADLAPQIGGDEAFAWYRLDPSALSTASLPAVIAGFDRLLADPPTVTTTDGDARVLRFSSFLPRLVDLAHQRAAASGELLSVSAAGPLGVALLVVVLATSVVVTRRRGDRSLLRARGAGAGATVMRSVGEIGCLTAPGAVVGWLGAVSLLPRASWGTGLVGGVLGLVLPPLVTAIVVLAEGLHDRGVRARPFRWVVEALVVAGAVSAVVAVLRRTPTPASDGVHPAGTASAGDPLVVLAPLLVVAVVVVLLLRVRPVLVRWTWHAVRERSAAAFLGTAEDARGGAAAAWVLAAVTLASGTGVLAAVLLGAVGAATARTSGATKGLDTSVLVEGASTIVVGGLVLAAFLTAAAVATTVVAASRDRQRRGALLRTFGLSSRDRTAVTVWELVPRCVLGVLGGTVVGLVSAIVVAPTVVPGTTGISPAPFTVVLTAVAFGLAATAATVVAVLSDRRRSSVADGRSAP